MGTRGIAAVKTEAVARHVLARAAANVGGVAALASRLNVSPRVLHQYVAGRLVVPDALFLQALDVVAEELPDTQLARQQSDVEAIPEPTSILGSDLAALAAWWRKKLNKHA
jgi:hypothetical protein